jgi:predicted amidohydrolase
MLDMLIQGGRVVTLAGVGDWDVGIVGEKIAAVTFPGMLPAAATQVIDARGKIVVPGGIETHAHAVANVHPGGPYPGARGAQRQTIGALPGGHLGWHDDGH